MQIHAEFTFQGKPLSEPASYSSVRRRNKPKIPRLGSTGSQTIDRDPRLSGRVGVRLDNFSSLSFLNS